MRKQESLYLRAVTREDAALLLEWRNEPETRRNSFTMEPISLATHLAWIDRILREQKGCYWVLMCGETPIGQVRVNVVPDDVGVISYSIAPNYRGQGYGKAILQLMEVCVRQDEKARISSLYAEVKDHNLASQKIFEQLGYHGTRETEHIKYRKSLA